MERLWQGIVPHVDVDFCLVPGAPLHGTHHPMHVKIVFLILLLLNFCGRRCF